VEERQEHTPSTSCQLLQDLRNTQVSLVTPPADVTPLLITPLIRIQMLMYGNGRHGAQGQMDSASKGTLENEFGTKSEEECIKAILEKGNLQDTEVCSSSTFHLEPGLLSYIFNVMMCANILSSRQMDGRQGPKNDSMGSRAAH
jgi:hypothetical protein